MATLVIPGRSAAGCLEHASEAVSLRSWLDDSWTLLFSHPHDLVRCELESDRWLAIVSTALTASGIRPLALAQSGRRLDAGWVTQIAGDERAVLIEEPADERHRDWLDLGARRLRDEILTMTQRFVMIVDPLLRIRRTYAYGAPEGLPSPLELVRWVGALRASPEAPDRREAPAPEMAHSNAVRLRCGSRSLRAPAGATRERASVAVRRPFGPYDLA